MVHSSARTLTPRRAAFAAALLLAATGLIWIFIAKAGPGPEGDRDGDREGDGALAQRAIEAAAPSTATDAEPSLSPSSTGQQPGRVVGAAGESSAPVPSEDRSQRQDAAESPDFVFDLSWPRGSELTSLEIARVIGGVAHSASWRLVREGTLLEVFVPPAERAALRGQQALELRTAERILTSGVLRLEQGGAQAIPIELVSVARAKVRLVEQASGEVVDAWQRFGVYELSFARDTRTVTLADGTQRLAVLEATVEAAADGSHAWIERVPVESLTVSLQLPDFEAKEAVLSLDLGRASEHTVRVERRRTVGTIAGVVRAASGNSPGPGGRTGRVRIMTVDAPVRHFNVPLEWTNGVAAFESVPLAAGEYRVFVDDTGPIHVTPIDELRVEPPAAGLAWTWNDSAERRSLAVRVFDADSGARIEEAYCIARWTSTRTNDARLWHELVFADVPIDHPVTFTIYADGRDEVTLAPTDFTQPGFVLPTGEEANAEDKGARAAWFADVRLPIATPEPREGEGG